MNNGTVLVMPSGWQGGQFLVLASQLAGLRFPSTAGCPDHCHAGSPNGLDVLAQELS
jgi:hypothetical protein